MSMLGLKFDELLSAIARWSLHVELEFAQINCGEILDDSSDGCIRSAGLLSRLVEACWIASCELPVALNKLEFAQINCGEILDISLDG